VTVARVSDLYRTAFVTGASTGLGRAFAEMLLADGVKVWGTARDAARLGGLTAQPNFTPVTLDLRDGARAEAVFREAEAASGGFDLVVNNAGYGVYGGFATTDFSVWQEQLEVMLVHTARLAHAAGPVCGGLVDRDRAVVEELRAPRLCDQSFHGIVIIRSTGRDHRFHAS